MKRSCARVLGLTLSLLALSSPARSTSLLQLQEKELAKQVRLAKIEPARATRLGSILTLAAESRNPRLRLLFTTLETLDLSQSSGRGAWLPLLQSSRKLVAELLGQERRLFEDLDQRLLPRQRLRIIQPFVKRIPAKIPKAPRNAKEQAFYAVWRSFLTAQRLLQPSLMAKIEKSVSARSSEAEQILREYEGLRARILATDLNQRLEVGQTLHATREFWDRNLDQIGISLNQMLEELTPEEQLQLTTTAFSLTRKLAWVARRFVEVEELNWIP